MIKCHVCGGEAVELFATKILRKYDGSLYQCAECGFAFFLNPIWLDEAYGSSLTQFDTGVVRRCVLIAAKVAAFSLLLKKNAGAIDIGGNTGLLSRLLRDYGLNSTSIDKHALNIYTNNFEPTDSQIATLIEVAEHFEDPQNQFHAILKTHKPDFLLFTTQLVPKSGLTKDWWYLQADSGQHISFHTKNSLRVISANTKNYSFYSCGDLHVFYKYSFVNRLKIICFHTLVAFKVHYLMYILYPFVSARHTKSDFDQLVSSVKSEER